jgi:hypothetical protein
MAIFPGSGGREILCSFVRRSQALGPAPRRTAKTPQNPAVLPLVCLSDARFAAVKQGFPRISLAQPRAQVKKWIVERQ